MDTVEGYLNTPVGHWTKNRFEMHMTEHDILSDAEREALNEVMKAPATAIQRVLLVEDDQLVRDLLADLLAFEGIECVKASSEEQALALLEADKSIGLILTDLNMPSGNGLHLIRHVRESERAELPVIIMSGDAGVRDAIEAMHLSVVDFLLKPIDPQKLVGLIRKELRN